MRYCDLNLQEIREKNDLDFAHYTYRKGMCSCCYRPLDLSKKYWRNNEIPSNKVSYSPNDDDTAVADNEYTYLLFKNADNCGGHVCATDEISDVEIIEWGFPISKLDSVCKDLQEMFGENYTVEKPENASKCIVVRRNV